MLVRVSSPEFHSPSTACCESAVHCPLAVGMTQTISLAAMAAEGGQQSQPAEPAQPAEAAGQRLMGSTSSGTISEAHVAANRFEQAVVAQGVSIPPGILRLGPDDVSGRLVARPAFRHVALRSLQSAPQFFQEVQLWRAIYLVLRWLRLLEVYPEGRRTPQAINALCGSSLAFLWCIFWLQDMGILTTHWLCQKIITNMCWHSRRLTIIDFCQGRRRRTGFLYLACRLCAPGGRHPAGG